MLRRFIDWWRGPDPASSEPDEPTRQTGAVPYRVADKGLEVLMITSRRTGRWLFPKGGLMAGLTPWDSAAEEAFEEAGVRGEIGDEPLGVYRTRRVRNERAETVEVVLYPLKVTRQFDRWPEKSQRRRRWVSLKEARGLVRDEAMLEVLAAAEARLGRAAQKAASVG